uniref:NADH dehydrogenase subunit 4 n=1 Tax=Patelloida saccharinoides TaxID=225156 RepID=UPI0023D7F894|nr:NADH dehydrogenase subunit 4 [Patelloida saccharinoides]WCR50861.1 NADH dehydrogenase subunit 4 [Patelloida saccharinoides]
MKLAVLLGIFTTFLPPKGLPGHSLRVIWFGVGCCILSLSTYQSSHLPMSTISPSIYATQFSPWLGALTWWISCLAMIVSPPSWLFGLLVALTNLLVFMSFFMENMFWFFVLFEASLLPMLILILGWGSYQERVQASSYMILYTVSASLPFLLLLALSKDFLNKYTCEMISSTVSILPSSSIYYSAMAAFLVKLPMYPCHLWLPKAHVEAPVAGSMILAGVMLKMGGFGLLSSLQFFSSSLATKNHLPLISIALWGGLLAAIACLRQADLKAAIAYSSVSHMSFVIAGALSLSHLGWLSSNVTMVSHGLTSSGLFCLVNVIFESTGTRSLIILGGLLASHRHLAFWGLVLFSANIPTPPWLSMAGEILVLPSIISASELFGVPIAMMLFLSGAYNLMIYTELFHGQEKLSTRAKSSAAEQRGHIALMGHMIPLITLMCFLGKF